MLSPVIREYKGQSSRPTPTAQQLARVRLHQISESEYRIASSLLRDSNICIATLRLEAEGVFGVWAEYHTFAHYQ